MVRRNRVDRPVAQGLDHGEPVLFGAQGGIHTVIGVAAQELRLRQREIMRTCLCGDAHAALFRVTDHPCRRRRADMADVHRHAVCLRQRNLPRCAAVLRGRGDPLNPKLMRHHAFVHQSALCEEQILTVRDHFQPDFIAKDHGVRQESGILDRPAVVGKSDRARTAQCAQIGRFLAFEPFRNRRRNIDVRVRFPRAAQDIGNHLRAVRGGGRVGHREHTRHTASRRRTAAGEDIFLMGLPRVAEMDVHIDEARRSDQAVCVDDARILCGKLPAHGGNLAVPEQQVARLVEVPGRIHQMCRFYQDSFRINHSFVTAPNGISKAVPFRNRIPVFIIL